MSDAFSPDEVAARRRDAQDPLADFRERFLVPRRPDGGEAVYFAGNSLGLQPRGVAEALRAELDDWARLAVDAHFSGRHPWYAYHEAFREPLARLLGAEAEEVVVMNGLTVNLHLMMVSFYRPTPRRYKILIEDAAFPSDNYAVRSQLRYHGHDPDEALVVARGDSAAIEALIEREGQAIALVLLGGVNYFTGEAFDMPRIAACARAQGCVVGFDLAHAAGNLVLALHDWDVDFAVWCSYKYLNAGPGAVAGCFVHRRHAQDRELPRFAGWWGNDPETRFRMHLQPQFEPREGADGWQLSNPPILALAPLRVSLELFDEAGMPALRDKALGLADYAVGWIDHIGDRRLEMLTPREAGRRGCQTSLRVTERPRELFAALQQAGVVADLRQPDVIRIAPVPFYNSFHDVWRFGRAVSDWSRR